MASIDVTDAGLIRAAPERVCAEILRLMAGETRWWLPHLEVRGLSQVAGVVGSTAEICVPGRARFIARIVELEAPRLLRVEYVEGDFLGVGLWRFDAVPEGTRISLRWQPLPTRWLLRVLSRVVVKNHSRVMQLGFAALDAHLNGERVAA